MVIRGNPNLFIQTVRVEVVYVTKRHRSPCPACGVKDKPGAVNLHITRGSGRASQSYRLCRKCSPTYLVRLRSCLTYVEEALRHQTIYAKADFRTHSVLARLVPPKVKKKKPKGAV